MKIQLRHRFEEIISVENLLEAWKEFVRGKRGKRDVQEFSFRLMNHIFALHAELSNHTYTHGGYQAFSICDPKPRNIHKAVVLDRLLHHAIHRKLYQLFDKTFIADSYSCRINKGTHKAINRFRNFAYKVSKNSTRTCWVLQCDIRKFFANINHATLVNILQKHIEDRDIMWLLEEIIKSFSTGRAGVGLPLGNLTSQLFVNIYMNEFDQFMKHQIKAKYYIRYADDFVIFSGDKIWLEQLIPRIRNFLRERLRLELHPNKVFLQTVASGIDFLGWVHFSDHRVLRTATKRRMMRKINASDSPATIASYIGMLQHGNTQRIREVLFEELSIPHFPMIRNREAVGFGDCAED